MTNDIFATYRRPARVLRRRIDNAPSEAGALVLLIVTCILIFVSQWPWLSIQSKIDPSIPFQARVTGALMAWIFIVPLAAYALSWITYLFLRLLGTRATAFEARMALFWALLAATPLWLLWGMLRAIVVEGPGIEIVGFLAFAAFVIFWSTGLREIHRPAAGKETR